MHFALPIVALMTFTCDLSLQAMDQRKKQATRLVLQVFTVTEQGYVKRRPSAFDDKKRLWSTMATLEFPRFTPEKRKRRQQVIGEDEFCKKPNLLLDSHILKKTYAARTALMDAIEEGITFDTTVALTGQERKTLHLWCDKSTDKREKAMIEWPAAAPEQISNLESALRKLNAGELNASLQKLRNACYINTPLELPEYFF